LLGKNSAGGPNLSFWIRSRHLYRNRRRFAGPPPLPSQNPPKGIIDPSIPRPSPRAPPTLRIKAPAQGPGTINPTLAKRLSDFQKPAQAAFFRRACCYSYSAWLLLLWNVLPHRHWLRFSPTLVALNLHRFGGASQILRNAPTGPPSKAGRNPGLEFRRAKSFLVVGALFLLIGKFVVISCCGSCSRYDFTRMGWGRRIPNRHRQNRFPFDVGTCTSCCSGPTAHQCDYASPREERERPRSDENQLAVQTGKKKTKIRASGMEDRKAAR